MSPHAQDRGLPASAREPRRDSNRKHPLMEYGTASLVVVFGLLASFAVFVFAAQTQKQASAATLDAMARDRAAALRSTVEGQLSQVDALHALFHSVDGIERREFARFARELLAGTEGIHALEWVPRVPLGLRGAFEYRARSDGLTGFEFLERAGDGSLRRAGERPEYFPVYFAEPPMNNESALGFDLASSPTRREAIELARSTRRLTATGRVVLVREPGSQYGVLVLYPVAAEEEEIDGFVLGVLRVESLLQASMARFPERGVEVVVFDETDSGRPEFLAQARGTTLVGGPDVAPPVDGIRGGEIRIANRTWVVYARLLDGASVGAGDQHPRAMLLIGVTATLALAGFLVHRVNVERRVRRFEEELTHLARVATTGELAASLAHELNQPLCAIVLNAQAARRTAASDPKAVERSLDRIVRDGERAGETIRNIRGFLNKGEVERERVRLEEVVRDAAEMFRATDRSGLRVDVHIDPDLPEVIANPVQIQQVVLNLMRNGVDAMDLAGPDRHHLRVDVRSEDGRAVTTSVEDEGSGLGDLADEELFSPFFTTKSQGMGIGLSISRSIVESHGGHIWGETTEEGGARFSFSLPVAEDE